MKLAAFRRRTRPATSRATGSSASCWARVSTCASTRSPSTPTWWCSSPQTRERREALADEAAAHDGLTLDEVVLLPPVYPTAMRDFLTFEAHVDGMERGHGNPGPPAEWYQAPVFLFMAPHAVTGRVRRRGDAAGHRAVRLRARDRGHRLPGRPQRDPGPGPRGDRRLLRDERLVGPRHPGPRDEAQARPVQGQGLRDHHRPVGRHRRRARRLPRRRRLPRPRDDGQRERRAGRRRPVRPHGLVLRAAGVARVPGLVGQGRRGARLRHLRVRLAGRVVGPHRLADPAAAPAGRRRRDDHRAHRHDPEPGRRDGRHRRLPSRPPAGGCASPSDAHRSRPSTRPRATSWRRTTPTTRRPSRPRSPAPTRRTWAGPPVPWASGPTSCARSASC